MQTTQRQHHGLTYTLQVTSTTLAEVVIARPDGTTIERREFVGSRAQAQALITWTKLTGLVGGRAA